LSAPAPIAVLLYVLFVKGCIRDGWPGWYYALQRLFAETLLALEIIDRRRRRAQQSDNDSREKDPARPASRAGGR
jgi:hypothetical protein